MSSHLNGVYVKILVDIAILHMAGHGVLGLGLIFSRKALLDGGVIGDKELPHLPRAIKGMGMKGGIASSCMYVCFCGIIRTLQ